MEVSDIKNTRKRTKSSITPQQMIELGKLPPKAEDLEMAVLGAIMLDSNCLVNIIDILNPDIFYIEKHQRIFAAIASLFEKGEPADILTVTQELKRMGELEIAGGALYITKLTNRIASNANVEFHARIVIEKYIQREIIRISTDTLQNAYEDSADIFDLLHKAEENIFSISHATIKKTFEHIKSVIAKSLSEIESAKNQEFNGVPSGFTSVDRITGGWQKSDLIILAARPGNGKCLGLGTKVIMYNGKLKKVEDILKGDLLMGPDSKPRRVLSTITGTDKMYWIRQNKAIDYRVNESHILSLKRSRNNCWYRNGVKHIAPGKHGDVLNISVKDYLNKLNPCLRDQKFKSDYKGYKAPIDFPAHPLRLEPYFLGVWLGDGTASCPNITTPDKEIIKYLKYYAKKLHLKLHTYIDPKKNNLGTYAITRKNRGNSKIEFSLKKLMGEMNLINNKHIPEEFLYNSRKNRLELLAGLLDTDGHLSGAGYEIIQKSEILIRQIKFLADSLGFRTGLGIKIGTIKSINFKGKYFRLTINGNIEEIPLKIKRKKLKKIKHVVDATMTGIKIEYDKVDNYYGFELDGDGLFLLEDCTVTHNSSYAMTVARNAAVDYKKPVAVFSLEMPSTQLVNRLISAESEINADKLRKGEITEIDWQKIHERIGKLAEAPIYIDDTAALSVFEFRAKAKRLVRQHGVKFIIVDYLQLMTGGQESSWNREQEVSHISKALKATAKELDIPILALSQLSRSVEQRADKRPQLSDLRESGSIEQDSDMVMFIYRPSISGILQDENGNSTEGKAEIIIAKHRNGKIDNADLLFIEQFAKFADISEAVNGFNTKQSTDPTPQQFEENAYANQRVEPNRDFMNQGPRMPYSERNDDFDLDA